MARRRRKQRFLQEGRGGRIHEDLVLISGAADQLDELLAAAQLRQALVLRLGPAEALFTRQARTALASGKRAQAIPVVFRTLDNP